MKAELPNPTLILTAGVAGTGKSLFIYEFVRNTPNTVFLDKDGLNNAFFHVKPTNQGQLPSMEETFKYYKERGMLISRKYFNGEEMIRVPFPTEYNGRHVRDQTYLAFAQLAKDNLQLGKSPIIQAIVHRQVYDRTLPGFIAEFRGFPVAILHFITDEKILRQRLIERAEKDEQARERDLPKLKNDEAWQEERKKQPIYWDELQFYSHHVVDNSNRDNLPLEQSVQQLVEQAEPYILRRASQRDELLYRVNEKGEILGAVHYSMAHPKQREIQGVRHRSTNLFIFKTSDKRELLIHQRGGNVAKAGAWDSSCGGHNLYGDTPLETIKKEAEEELFSGQLPKELEIRQTADFPSQTRPNDPNYVFLYQAIYPGPFNPGEEVADLKFIDIDWLKKDTQDNPEKYGDTFKFTVRRFL